MNNTHDMRALRLHLVDCERALRTDREYFEQIKATISKRGFDDGEITGKNAEERDRNLIVYLATDEQYRLKSSELRHTEWQRDRCAALLEAAKDDRRAAELDARNRRTAAYERLAIQRDKPDRPGVDRDDEDDQIDDTADDWRAREMETDDWM